MPIEDYAGSNKILRTLYAARGTSASIDARFAAIESGAVGGGGSGTGIENQINKLNIVAPYTETITIDSTTDFKKAPLEVLKFVPGEQNQVTTICQFLNSDSTAFQPNDYIVFDGSMHLETSRDIVMTSEGTLGGDSSLFSVVLDKVNLNIESVEVL